MVFLVSPSPRVVLLSGVIKRPDNDSVGNQEPRQRQTTSQARDTIEQQEGPSERTNRLEALSACPRNPLRATQ